ncbi:MAG: UDP-N-acetylglucosamine 1-carboxyvinyltransferase [Alphaproteobacteria bacterium]|nr:UDP-N-acetylglucosamine 1-carboxyvinyltransferase [Alphaproteobacteria bacterium]
MDKLIIRGGKALSGSVSVQGAKNALLPLMVSSVLRPSVVTFSPVSALKDVILLGTILEDLGAQTSLKDGGIYCVDTRSVQCWKPRYEHVSKMRASFLLLGSLLGRFGEARVPLPGGCSIGSRPVQWHLEGIQKLGVDIALEKGFVQAKVARLQGAQIDLPYPTVGGTQNILTVAVLSKGETTITGAACEPEVVELCKFLVKSGAKIDGIGTRTLTIQGVDTLNMPESWCVLPDRIEALTYAVMAAITKGDLIIKNNDASLMEGPLELLQSIGVDVSFPDATSMRVRRAGVLKAFDFESGPYPAFSTDLQSFFMALSIFCEGDSTIKETVFLNRFMHALEFIRMGANITLQGDRATVHGGANISGATVMASDLRAGAALVACALGAEGETHIRRIYHTDRGYERIEEKLAACGADIVRVAE